MKKVLSALFVVLFFVGITNAQGKMALGFNAGIALPMGDFGDGFDMGFGGSALFIYHATPNIDVTGSAGYLTWSGKDESDVTFSSIPVMVGARYLFGQGKFNPYINAELGMHFTTVDIPEVEIPGVGTFGGGSESDSNFGWGAGAGFLYQIGNNMDLDVNARYNSITGDGGSSDYVSIMVGLLFGLN